MSRRTLTSTDSLKLVQLMNQIGASFPASTRTDVENAIMNNNAWYNSNNFNLVSLHVNDEVRKSEEIENQLRLPKTSVPERYKIHIDARNIHTGALDYTGDVEIEVLVKEATDYILLHSKTQVITALHVYNQNGMTEVPLIEYSLYPAVDTLTIYFLNEVEANTRLLIHVAYTTNLLTGGSGFYRTSYVLNGQTRYLGATQFQPAHARYAFPHYDEPGFKAIFDLSITHDVSRSAIANTFGNSVIK